MAVIGFGSGSCLTDGGDPGAFAETAVGFDSTGATVLNVFAVYFGSTPTISDTYNNTWIEVVNRLPHGAKIRYYRAQDPIQTGPNHKFRNTTLTSSGFPGIAAVAFDQTDNEVNASKTNAPFTGVGATVASGPVTPTEPGALIVTAVAYSGVLNSMSTPPGFTLILDKPPTSESRGIAVAYAIGADPVAAISTVWDPEPGTAALATAMVAWLSEDAPPQPIAEGPFTLPDIQTGKIGPLLKIRIYNPALDAEYVASTQWIQDPATYWGGFAEASLLRVDDIVYATSDRAGPLQVTALAFEMSDVAHGDTATPRMRSWLDQVDVRQLRRCEIWAQMITDSLRRQLQTPVTVFRGYIEEFSVLDEFRVSFDCLGWINRVKDRPVLPHLIGDLFPTSVKTVREQRVPLALGLLSDEGSEEDPPVFVEDEAGRGTNGGAANGGGGSFNPSNPLNTFGNETGGVPAPTGLSLSEDVGAGGLRLASASPTSGSAYQDKWCVQVVRVRGGARSDPEPFDPGDEFITIGADNAAITAVCSNAGHVGGDVYRFYLGTMPSGGGRPNFTHYIQTSDPVTGVQFTLKNLTPGGVRVTASHLWAAAVWVYGDGRTEPAHILGGSIPAAEIVSSDLRPVRLTLEPPGVGAVYGEMYVSPQPDKEAIDRKFVIDISNTNTNGDIVWAWDMVTPGAEADGIPAPLGMVPPIYLGQGVVLDNDGFAGWHCFLLSGRPCKEFISSYLDGVRIAEGTYSAEIAAPGKGNWNTWFGPNEYIEVTADGETFRLYMMFVLQTPISDQILGLNGATQVDFRVNMSGLEDAGDGTGNVVTDGYSQLPIVLKQLAFPDEPSMAQPFNQDPQFSDGTKKINDNAFAEAREDAVDVIPSGPTAARWISSSISVQDLVAEWALSLRARVYTDESGQFGACVTNPSGGHVYDILEREEVIRGSFGTRDTTQGYGQRVPYRWNPRYSPDGSEEMIDEGEEISTSAISETHEDIPLQTHDLPWRIGVGPARQVAVSILRESEYMPRTINSGSVLHWLTQAPLGKRVSLTHSQGLAPGGWSKRIIQVLGKRLSPTGFTVSLTALDLRRSTTLDPNAEAELTWEQYEAFMSTMYAGGSRIDSLMNDGTYDVFPNWGFIAVDWDGIPTTHGMRLRSNLLTDGDLEAAVYEEADLSTAVATSATHSSATMTELAAVDIPRPVGDGPKRYMVRPILGGAATLGGSRGIVFIEGYAL